jgi:hypothetical protein
MRHGDNYKVLDETELLDQDTLEIEWPSSLESAMSEYDTYLLLLDNTQDNDYFSSYCAVQRPEYHKMH